MKSVAEQAKMLDLLAAVVKFVDETGGDIYYDSSFDEGDGKSDTTLAVEKAMESREEVIKHLRSMNLMP